MPILQSTIRRFATILLLLTALALPTGLASSASGQTLTNANAAPSGSSGIVTPDTTIPPDGGAPPCGDTVYVTSVSRLPLGMGEAGLWLYSFKVVGVGLSKWLGAGGYGLMEVWIHDSLGYHHAGAYNASAGSGARTPTLAAQYEESRAYPYVTVQIENSNGYALCWEKDTIK